MNCKRCVCYLCERDGITIIHQEREGNTRSQYLLYKWLSFKVFYKDMSSTVFYISFWKKSLIYICLLRDDSDENGYMKYGNFLSRKLDVWCISDTNRVTTHEYHIYLSFCQKGKTITILNELSYLFMDLICKKKISNVI